MDALPNSRWVTVLNGNCNHYGKNFLPHSTDFPKIKTRRRGLFESKIRGLNIRTCQCYNLFLPATAVAVSLNTTFSVGKFSTWLCVQAVTTGLSDSLVCTVFIGIKTNRVCDIQSFFSPPSTVGSGTRWKFSAVCGFGVCHSWDGWGSTATHWWQAAGWDTHQGVLLCPWPSWKKHVGCSDCCPNHGIGAKLTFTCHKVSSQFSFVLIACLVDPSLQGCE